MVSPLTKKPIQWQQCQQWQGVGDGEGHIVVTDSVLPLVMLNGQVDKTPAHNCPLDTSHRVTHLLSTTPHLLFPVCKQQLTFKPDIHVSKSARCAINQHVHNQTYKMLHIKSQLIPSLTRTHTNSRVFTTPPHVSPSIYIEKPSLPPAPLPSRKQKCYTDTTSVMTNTPKNLFECSDKDLGDVALHPDKPPVQAFDNETDIT